MGYKKWKHVDRLGRNVELDQAVVDKLPPKSKVTLVVPSGASLWVGTVRIEVQLENGEKANFFKKGATGELGAAMMEGAFKAEQALFTHLPKQVPKPVAWGTYASNPETHFYMCEFVDMYDDLPPPRSWAQTVSSLHLNSMGKSPTGQFGFPVATHLANVRVNNNWNSSWEKFWAQQMKSLFDHDERANGPDEALAELKKGYFEKVIPRYLRPLEADGRSIQPCLIHSDLWPGNIKPKAATDELCMFDACAYWGHNEADLAICRNPRYKLGPPCIREYFKRVAVSEPASDFDGRNATYAMKYYALLSGMYSSDKRFRDIFASELKSLIDKVDAEGGAPASHRL